VVFLISGSLLCFKQDIKCEMNSMMNRRATGPEGSCIGVYGIDQCPLNPVVCFYFLILLCSFYRFYDFTALVFFFFFF
jgi:hypothetical protein